MSDILHVEAAGAVAVITLHRPDALNALNGALLAELSGAVASIDCAVGTARSLRAGYLVRILGESAARHAAGHHG